MTDITMAAGTFKLADVFGRAFTVYTRRFIPLIILTIIASIPNYIIIFVIGTPTIRGPADDALYDTARTILFLMDFAARSLVSGAVIYGVIQELRGQAFSVGDLMRIALRRFLPMLGVLFSFTFVIVLALFLLVIPGFMLACMYYVSMPVCVAENPGVFKSMARSRFLTEGHRWQLFGAFLLMLLAGLIIGAIIWAAFALAGRPALLVTTQEAGVVLQPAFLAATQVAGVLVGTFNGVLVSVFYYELRAAKEGGDIEKFAGVFD